MVKYDGQCGGEVLKLLLSLLIRVSIYSGLGLSPIKSQSQSHLSPVPAWA